VKQSQYWRNEIEDIIGVQFKLIASKFLVGVLLFVYVKEKICNHVKDVRCTTAGVGVMGMMGNKGGVSVHFYLYDTSICCTCAHLAAHRENVAGIN
jgi:phosphatidylinositol-bisphosphatase